jgi:hypothetical protein
VSIRIPLVDWRQPGDAVRRLADAIRELADGRSNGFGSVTLADGTATTGTDTVVTFMPTTANAAAEVGAGGMYVGTVTNGSFTITHANNAQTDRTFTYCLQG